MNTKFILHGGMISQSSDQNDNFFREFTKDLKDGDKVVWIGFARLEPEDQLKTFERDKELILAQTKKDVIVEMAKHDTLLAQLQEARAVFVTGGKTRALMHDLSEYGDDLKQVLSGKVYAGTSAGAQILAQYFHLCQENQAIEGMSWLPIRLMVHYGSDEFNGTDEALEKLKKYPPGSVKDDLELVTLRECEWTVREINLG